MAATVVRAIAEPTVPSLKETLLERKRKDSLNLALSVVQSARADDRTFLESLLHVVQEKLQDLEGPEAAEAEGAEET